MKKFMNDPHSYVEDYLKGILSAHGDLYTLSEENERALCLKHPTPGKVAIVTGGGSGHLPLFLGYVGDGLAADFYREIAGFLRSPDRELVLDVLHEIDADVVALQEADKRFGGRGAALPHELIDDHGLYRPVYFGVKHRRAMDRMPGGKR